MSEKRSPMTAAEYAAHAEKVKAKEAGPTEIVTLKSGSVFELRKVDLKGMVQLGLIPQTLVSESLKALEGQGKYTPPDTVNLKIESLILQREVVAAACVMPPFNEETAKSFLREDFEEIYLWALGHQGVEGAQALKSFRKGRKRGTARSRNDGQELQSTTVSAATN